MVYSGVFYDAFRFNYLVDSKTSQKRESRKKSYG